MELINELVLGGVQIGVLEDTRNRTLGGILRVQSCFRGYLARRYLKELRKQICFLQSFIHAEKTRKTFFVLLQRHKAAVVIQKHAKGKFMQMRYVKVIDASVLLQSVIRGCLVRKCSENIGLLHSDEKKGNQSQEAAVKSSSSSYLGELQRRVLKAEAGLREKEEENEILQQRLHQYEKRWSDYELKMNSMEELWQKQMRSLQSSLSIAKTSLAVDKDDEADSERSSDVSVNASEYNGGTAPGTPRFNGLVFGGMNSNIHNKACMSAGVSVISRLGEEFEQRRQVFGDDAKFLVEVKSGQVEACLDPDRELRRLKATFEAWKKDYGTRLRETKVILHKLEGEDGGSSYEKVRKKWWSRRNSRRMNYHE